jgi:hypothetical protein
MSGRMPGLDEGADPAHLPGPTGGLEPVASAASPARPSMGRGPLVASTGVEPQQAPCLSPRSPPVVLAVPCRIFAVLGHPGGGGKNPAAPGAGPEPDRGGCVKSWKLLFSKKLANFKAALALHFAHYNFMRLPRSLRVTPAMEAKFTDHIWTWEELLSH